MMMNPSSTLQSSSSSTSAATAAAVGDGVVVVGSHPSAVFLHTIPEDGSDYADQLPPSSSVSVAADTATDGGGSDDPHHHQRSSSSSQQPQYHDRNSRSHQQEPKSWWKLRTAALWTPPVAAGAAVASLPLTATERLPPHQQPQLPLHATRRLSSAPSVDSSSAEEDRTTITGGVGAPPSSTGAMEAGHAGSIVAVSEAGAVIVGEAPSRSRDRRRPDHRLTSKHAHASSGARRRPSKFDPKLAPPLTPEEARRRQQCFYLMVLLAIVLVAGIVVGIVFAVKTTTTPEDNANNSTNHTEDHGGKISLPPTVAPSMAPTFNYPIETVQALDELLFNLSNASLSWINDTTSPRFMARDWLLHVDQLQVVAELTSSSSNNNDTTSSSLRDDVIRRVTQRYILCLLYWNFDRHPVDLLNATAHECEWDGVRCYNENSTSTTVSNDNGAVTSSNATMTNPGRRQRRDQQAVGVDETTTSSDTIPPHNAIQRLEWTGQNLTGTLPDELTHLRWLRNIQMDYNHLEGTLPLEAWSKHQPWTELRHVTMVGNQLTGHLASSPSFSLAESFPSLVYFDVSDNLLSGPMLLDWTQCSKLRFFYLANNFLTGRIVPPHNNNNNNNNNNSNATTLVSPILELLDLSNNYLSGPIVSLPFLNWSSFERLQYLSLHNNDLSGWLVVETTNATTTGATLTSSPLAGLTSLVNLDLSNNSFRGPMFDLTPFEMLNTLDLTNNTLTGTLGEPPYYAVNGIQGDGSGSEPGFGGGGAAASSNGTSTASNATSSPVPASTTNSFSSALMDIRIGDNNLTGTLSSTWAGLSLLHTLILYGNQLNGTLPTTWTAPELAYVELSYNQFSGSVPESLLELDMIQHVYLHDNRLTSLPPGNQTSQSLNDLTLHSNQFQGTVPPDFAHHWTNLTILTMSNNTNLSGILDVNCNLTDLVCPNTTSSNATTASSLQGVVTCTC